MSTSNNKRIAKNTLLLYIRMFILLLVGLYTSRIVLNTLGVEDFGIYNVVGGIVAFLSFVKASLSNATSRFVTISIGKKDYDEASNVMATSLIVHVLFSILLLIVAETIGLCFLVNQMNIPINRIHAAMWVYHCSVITAIATILCTPYNALIIAYEKMNVFTIISIIETILKLSIVFLLPLFTFDKLSFYAALVLISQIIINICYLVYCNINIKDITFKINFDKHLFIKMSEFIGWKLTDSLAAVGYTQGLNILLNIFFNPMVNAARGIAVQVEGVVKNFCLNFQTALQPQLTKAYAKEDYNNMYRLIIIGSKFSFYLLLCISIPIMLEIDTLLKWWLGVIPEHCSVFVRLILAACLMSALANPLIISINAKGQLRKFQIAESSILILILPVSYILLKLTNLNPEWVFIVNLIFTIFAHIVRTNIILPMLNMSVLQYVKDLIFPILFVIIISPIIPLIIKFLINLNELYNFVIVCLSSLVSFTVTSYCVGCTKEERKQINNFLSKHIATLRNKYRDNYKNAYNKN